MNLEINLYWNITNTHWKCASSKLHIIQWLRGLRYIDACVSKITETITNRMRLSAQKNFKCGFILNIYWYSADLSKLSNTKCKRWIYEDYTCSRKFCTVSSGEAEQLLKTPLPLPLLAPPIGMSTLPSSSIWKMMQTWNRKVVNVGFRILHRMHGQESYSHQDIE